MVEWGRLFTDLILLAVEDAGLFICSALPPWLRNQPTIDYFSTSC